MQSPPLLCSSRVPGRFKARSETVDNLEPSLAQFPYRRGISFPDFVSVSRKACWLPEEE